QVYGVDPGTGTIVRFAFDTGESASVPAPEKPSGFADGLAVASATDAFFVNGFSTQIFEFNPQTGALIAGAFPVPPPGMPNCTDGLAIVAPTRLFTQNFCESTIYEIDTRTGMPVASHFVPAGLFGGLAGGNGRLFASTGGFGSIASIVELDPESGKVLNAFPAPGSSFPFPIWGLAF